MKIERLQTRFWGALLAIAAASCQTPPPSFSDVAAPADLPALRVRRVPSGQTLEVIDPSDGTTRKIRLLGIDAPDLQQDPWGDRARQTLEALALDREIRADIRRRDRFGRDWAYVWLDNGLANAQLVAAGQALVASNIADPDYARQLQQAQERARLLELGIWDPAEPLRQPPQTFRAQRRNFPDNGGN